MIVEDAAGYGSSPSIPPPEPAPAVVAPRAEPRREESKPAVEAERPRAPINADPWAKQAPAAVAPLPAPPKPAPPPKPNIAGALYKRVKKP